MTVELDSDELALLVSVINDRIRDARAAGVPDSQESAIFREQLFNKLIQAHQKALAENPR
jgi:hypothetical protein